MCDNSVTIYISIYRLMLIFIFLLEMDNLLQKSSQRLTVLHVAPSIVFK